MNLFMIIWNTHMHKSSHQQIFDKQINRIFLLAQVLHNILYYPNGLMCLLCQLLQLLLRVLNYYYNKTKQMQLSTIDFQNAKNRRRLIQQNNKLRQQVTQIQSQISTFAESMSIDEQIEQNTNQHLLQEIAIQERLIRQLRAKIEAFKLERAKDNVQYIIHQEDDLKMAKKLCSQLIDQREVLQKRKNDKNEKLLNNLPYQNYQEKFLVGLMEVVHHNREQGAKITEIERQIRKYHLMVKNGKFNQSKIVYTNEDVYSIEKQIAEKTDKKKQLEKQWKPHLQQLDEQYSKLLRELANKKEVLSELQREDRAWDTRMLTVKDPQQIKINKKRVSKITVNPKLKQQLQDYILHQSQKGKKRVNNDQLKYQFKSNAKQQEQKKEKEKKAEIPPPPSIAKKKQQKIIETMHDDKNISKKIEKGNNTTKKISKVDQMHNTQITVPIQKLTSRDSESKASKVKNSQDSKTMNESKQKNINEERTPRLWQNNPESNKKQSKANNKTQQSKETKNNILRLKEVSISTDARLWKNQQ